MRTKYDPLSLLDRDIWPVILALVVTLALVGCDQSSQNIDFVPGNSLTINGPGTITLPNYDSSATGEYMVRAFTIEQEYSWSVSGPATLDGTRREGEVAMVSTSTPGSYSVSVTTTIDGDSYSGTAGGMGQYPSALDQAEKYALSTFGQASVSTGLIEGLPTGVTVFAPSNAAFLAALDANDDGELASGEMPPPGVLASILTYHVAIDSLTTSDISAGQEVSTALHAEETVAFSENGSIVVEGTESSAAFVAADIATSDSLVMHKVDGVLFPSSVVSINDQTLSDGTVEVAGAFVADGGFVALHEGSASGEIVGASEYLEASASDAPHRGFYSEIAIDLDTELSDTTNVVAMTHRDTNGDGFFTFEPDVGLDAPYTRGSSTVPVTDSASVAVP